MLETSRWQFLQSPGTNAGLSLALGVATPIASFVTLSALHTLAEKTLYWSGYPFFFAHAVLGILVGLSACHEEVDLEWPILTRLCAGIGILTCLLTLLLLAALVRAIPFAQQFKKMQCQDNLKILGLAMKMYEDESEQHRFPPLSARPGELAMALDSVYPELLSDLNILTCRSFKDRRLFLQHDSEFLHVLSDQSYYYLGYAIDSPAALKAFHDAYARVIAEGGDFHDDLPAPPGQGTWGGGRILRLSRDVLAGISPAARPLLPVMIERVEIHNKGASQRGINVLYSDGSPRWLAYPGEWPADEETMRLLRSMDKMGDHIPDGTFQGPMAPSMPLLTLLGLVLGGVLFGAWACTTHRVLCLCLVYATTGVIVAFFLGYSASVNRSTLPIAAPDGGITIHDMVDGKQAAQWKFP